jgi:hypothetical protein
LIAAYAQLKRRDDAANALLDYLRLYPKARVADLERLPFKNRRDLDHIQDGLPKAELPE